MTSPKFEIQRLSNERDDALGRLHASESRCAAMERALRAYVKHFGPAHDPGCPEDDTCDCSRKALNDQVNAALSAEPAKPSATAGEGGE